MGLQGVAATGEGGAKMELSTRGRYAVMAMADLAEQARAGNFVTLAQIAARQEISQSYLEQLFGRLRKAGLVAASRGPGGGYRLAREAQDIIVGDIMRAVDEKLRATRCSAQTRAGCLLANKRCTTHDLWEGLTQHIAAFFASVTLADVIERKIVSPALLGAPQMAAQ
ncbi:MAG: hypothetical protein RL186_1284 [Pseudomonadota bacterium]|jgi:Rrf2 family iron-sulfur cluster assembly transcriptional regulator